jgi:hypothetical protein
VSRSFPCLKFGTSEKIRDKRADSNSFLSLLLSIVAARTSNTGPPLPSTSNTRTQLPPGNCPERTSPCSHSPEREGSMGLGRPGGTRTRLRRLEVGEGSQGGRRGCSLGRFRWLSPMLMMSGSMVSIRIHRGFLFWQPGTRS